METTVIQSTEYRDLPSRCFRNQFLIAFYERIERRLLHQLPGPFQLFPSRVGPVHEQI